MVVYNLKFFLVLILWCLSGTAHTQEPKKIQEEPGAIKKIDMIVGEVLSYNLPMASHLNLSKRGVVILSYIAANKWRLIAHRKGFVVLTYQSEETEKENQIFIQVKEKPKDTMKPQDSSAYCQLKKVICSMSPFEISGETDSWQSFYQLNKLCREKKSCVFSLKLSEKGQTLLRARLQDQMGYFSKFKVSTNGVVSCSVMCDVENKSFSELKKKVKKVLESQGILSYVPVFCDHLVHHRQFVVYARVVLASHNLAKKIGVSRTLVKKIIDDRFNLTPELLKQFKSHESDHYLKIIGTPTLTLNEGVRSLSKTGGELSLVKETSSFRENQKIIEWKSYGLQISFLAFSFGGDKSKVSYKLAMNVPSESRYNLSLQTIELEGEVNLVFNVPKIVGSTDYKREKKSLEKNIFLSSIPIISPLFKMSQNEEVLSQMLLCLMIKKT